MHMIVCSVLLYFSGHRALEINALSHGTDYILNVVFTNTPPVYIWSLNCIHATLRASVTPASRTSVFTTEVTILRGV